MIWKATSLAFTMYPIIDEAKTYVDQADTQRAPTRNCCAGAPQKFAGSCVQALHDTRNGKCQNQIGTFTCHCSGTGYEGDLCEVDINECIIDAPCKNNGRCENQNGTFICHCNDTGYKRDYCALDVNECEFDQSCKNGGACTNHAMKEIRLKNYHNGLTNFDIIE